MGWHTGILLFNGTTDTDTISAKLMPEATPTGTEWLTGDALSSREPVIGLGTYNGRSFLIDRYRTLELTTDEADDPAADAVVGQLARRVLATYLHEVSGSYGMVLFENGQRTMAFYTQEGQVQHQSRAPDLSPTFAALPLPTDGDIFFQYIDLFMDTPFAEWTYSTKCVEWKTIGG